MAAKTVLGMLVALLCVATCSAGKTKISNSQLEQLADTAARKGETNNAIKYYGQLIFQAPSQLVYWKRSQLYARQKKYSKVIDDLKKAVEKDAKFTKAYVEMGRVQLISGQCEEAVESFQQALKIKPTDKTSNEKLPTAVKCKEAIRQADAECSQGGMEACKHHLTEAMSIAYDSIPLLLKRAEVHYATSDYQSLLVDTRTVLKMDKNELQALYLRGKAYYRMGDHDVALAHYKEGLRSDPEHSKIKKAFNILKKLIRTTNMAKEMQDEGNYADAAQQYAMAIKVDPENHENVCQLYIRKCEALHKSGEWEAGVEACNMAINFNENDIHAWMQRGEAKIRGEQYDDAIRDFQRATEIDEHSQEAKDALHKAQLELKKSQRKNYYKILGVSNNANEREIKRAFRKQALKWHPDKHKGEEAMKVAEMEFREINEANEVLSDPEKRGRYDRGEDIEVPQQQQNPFQHFHGFGGGGGNFHFEFN